MPSTDNAAGSVGPRQRLRQIDGREGVAEPRGGASVHVRADHLVAAIAQRDRQAAGAARRVENRRARHPAELEDATEHRVLDDG
jgi:hypothetical protein